MKEYKEVLRTTPDKLLAQTTCDVCGRKSDGPSWDKGRYDVADSTIKLRMGECYPECGGGEEWVIDICPECFKERLIPWVESFGYSILAGKNWDW